jgi:predicted phosphodiesterase
MFVRYMSDVHLEFGWMHLMSLEEDKDTVLVLAGDIGLAHNHTQLVETLGRFLVEASVQFRAVIYVLGNHEHYKYSITKTYDTIRHLVADRGLQNVFVLENETHLVDNVAFIGATLWTDYNNDPVKLVLASQMMNDHRLIRIGTAIDPYHAPFTPAHAKSMHKKSRKYVFEQAKEQKAAGKKVVVVVHHGVSEQSVHERFKGSPYNPAFVSDLTKDILDAQPHVVIHGHVHNAFDYTIGDTRVLVNPRGYVGYETEVNGFDPVARFEI